MFRPSAATKLFNDYCRTRVTSLPPGIHFPDECAASDGKQKRKTTASRAVFGVRLQCSGLNPRDLCLTSETGASRRGTHFENDTVTAQFDRTRKIRFEILLPSRRTLCSRSDWYVNATVSHYLKSLHVQ